jgi:hypothetical protein
VRDRAIPDDIAQQLGWGYVSDHAYLSRHRLFIPYTDPDRETERAQWHSQGGKARSTRNTAACELKLVRNRYGIAARHPGVTSVTSVTS